MPGATAVAAIPFPIAATDAPSAVGIENLAKKVDQYVTGRFTTTAARDTAIPIPILDQLCTVAGIPYRWTGAGWQQLWGGAPEVMRSRAAAASLAHATFRAEASLTAVAILGAGPGLDLVGTARGVAIVTPGRYEGIVKATYGANVNGRRTLKMDKVATGATGPGYTNGATLTGPSDIGLSIASTGSLSMPMIYQDRIDCAAGDVLGVWTRQESGAGISLDVINVSINVWRVG